MFYSPPESRLQTFLTCHQAQTQEPEETTPSEFPFQGSSSAAGTLETSRPLQGPNGPGVGVAIIPWSPVSRTRLAPSLASPALGVAV